MVENVTSCARCPFVEGADSGKHRCEVSGMRLHHPESVPESCPLWREPITVKLADSVHGPSPWKKAEHTPGLDPPPVPLSARLAERDETVPAAYIHALRVACTMRVPKAIETSFDASVTCPACRASLDDAPAPSTARTPGETAYMTFTRHLRREEFPRPTPGRFLRLTPDKREAWEAAAAAVIAAHTPPPPGLVTITDLEAILAQSILAQSPPGGSY
jgi:hypothetical protein